MTFKPCSVCACDNMRADERSCGHWPRTPLDDGRLTFLDWAGDAAGLMCLVAICVGLLFAGPVMQDDVAGEHFIETKAE